MDFKICALIASFFAMTFVVISYFVKKKEKYLLFQFLCIFFLIISYFFNAQYFAMVGLVIGLGRTLTFFLYEKRGTRAPILWAVLFSSLSLASYLVINLWILGSAQPLDLLFLVGLIGYAFIFRIRSLKAVRFLMLAPTILAVLFNLLTDAPLFALLSYSFELLANVVSIFKYHVFGRKSAEEKKESEACPQKITEQVL